MPNLVVAIVVLVIGGLLANTATSLVRGATAEAGFDNPERLAKVASTAIWTFATVIAANQIVIAETLVNTLVMGAVGAMAVAAGLAFGLGGRDTAAKIVEKWYQQTQAVAPKNAAASENIGSTVDTRAKNSMQATSRLGG